MRKETRRNFFIAAGCLAAFALWTLAVCHVDVQPIGPLGTTVGFASANQFVHSLTGVHMALYTLTDWLGLAPMCIAAGFALLGLNQWIRRRHITRVDRSIRMLGVFYAAVVAAYIFFETVVVNYRPVLIGGVPEASYPSSTTMLVLCVIPTAIMQLRWRIRNQQLRRWLILLLVAFTVFMVVGQLLSGVHWLSDIIGGVLLSAGLVTLYRALCDVK